MSTFKAKAIMERRGFSGEAFLALHKLATSHADKRGGQHTNGGCRNGRCDYGVATCAAWHGIGEAIVEMDRELEGVRAENAELAEALVSEHGANSTYDAGPGCGCKTCRLLSRIDARIAGEKP